MSKKTKILLLALCCQIGMATPGWSVEVGQPAPDFSMQTFAGNRLSRASLKGKPLLLVFWNTWCVNCKKEMPRIGRLARDSAAQGLTVLAINTGLNDSEQKARDYWKKNGYSFPVGFDRHFDIGESFGVLGVPTVLLVDAGGVVRYKSPVLPDNMAQRIGKLSGR